MLVFAFFAYETASGMWNNLVTRLRYRHYREFLEELVGDGKHSSLCAPYSASALHSISDAVEARMLGKALSAVRTKLLHEKSHPADEASSNEL